MPWRSCPGKQAGGHQTSALTAQHYSNEVADGLRLLKTQLKAPSQQVKFDLHAGEIQGMMNNLVYNVGMNVQAHMNG